MSASRGSGRLRLVHVTTTDISLALLLGPQLLAFRDAGYEVIGVSAPGHFARSLEDAGIQHVPLRHSTRAMAPHRDAAAFGELFAAFRRLRPDIVHTHNPKPGVYGRIAARAARVPVVVNTVHGLYALPDDPVAKRILVYTLERLAATCSDAELLQNPEDRPVLRRLGVPRSKLTVLGNGIDLGRFCGERIDPGRRDVVRKECGAAPGDVLVGAVGRLVREKGYAELLAAARRLAPRWPHLRFVIVGGFDPDKPDGLQAADVEAAERLGNVRFLGHRDDVDELYGAMDLYVLASHREGFPRSAMEAAACGVPIIATDVRGCRQVVDHGRTGVLVPVGDTVALEHAIVDLADDAPRRAAFGLAGAGKARQEFDQRRVIDTTLATYERLAAAAGL